MSHCPPAPPISVAVTRGKRTNRPGPLNTSILSFPQIWSIASSLLASQANRYLTMWLTAFLALCFNIVAVLGNLDGFFDEFRQAPETVDCSSQEAETIIDVIAMLQFKVKFALIDEDDLRAHINVESLGDEQDTLDALPYCTIELRERYFGKTTAEDDAYIWSETLIEKLIAAAVSNLQSA